MTESESLLEELLSSKDIEFLKIPESITPTPDFKVTIHGEESYWEVKELEENPDEKGILKDIKNGCNEIYSVNSQRVENSIKFAAKQFKGYGVTDKPCIVVLYDSRDFATMDFLFLQYIQTAILGSAEYMKKTDGTVVEVNRRDGLLTQRKKYISAIAVISRYSKDILFLHNPNTSYPVLNKWLPPIFTTHYQAVTDAQGLQWIKV